MTLPLTSRIALVTGETASPRQLSLLAEAI